MDTPNESRNLKDTGSIRVNSKSSMSSSCQDLSVQSSPASSQILSNESRLSSISQATIQSINNNARITSGKKSDSSHVSTPELSNRSQLSAKDQPQSSDRSLNSVKGHRTLTSGNRVDVPDSTSPTKNLERSPRSVLRVNINTEYAHPKESLRKRMDVTPHKDSPRKPLRTNKSENVLPTLTRGNRKIEIESKEPKSYSSTEDATQHNELKSKPKSSRKNTGNTEENQVIVKPEPKSETDRNTLKKSTDDENPKSQLKNRLPSKLPTLCKNINRQAKPPIEVTKPKQMATEPAIPACRNSTKNYTKTRETSKKVPVVITNNNNKLKPQPIKGKPSSVQASGPLPNKTRSQFQGSMAKKMSTTSVSDSKSKLSNSMTRKKNHNLDSKTTKQTQRKASTELGAELDTAGQQKFVAAKDSELDAAQIEEYFKLMDIYNENERTIEGNQRKIDLQEKEMDELYPVVREEIDDMAGCIGEMARIRMIHKNFKDEATRIRVQHMTNLLETDIYEEANTELKEHLSNLNQEITETKAINALNPEDVQTKSEMVWKQYDNQRQTNASIEQEIQKLKDDLNAYMCGRVSQSTPQGAVDNLIDLSCDVKSKHESLGNPILTKDKRAGESKSADEVSFTKEHGEDPREIKSDHQQESRFKKILRSARGLLPDRKKKQADQKKNKDTTDKEQLPEKRHYSDQNAGSRCKEPIGRKSDVHLPPISTVPVESRINHNHKVSNFSLFSQQPAQYKRFQHHILSSNDNESNPAVHAPHPPISPRPENARKWKLRTTSCLRNK